MRIPDLQKKSDEQVLRIAAKFVRKLNGYLKGAALARELNLQFAEVIKRYPKIPVFFVPVPHQSRIDHWTQERDYWRNTVLSGKLDAA